VYSNSTVDAAAHCFTDIILQAMDLAIPPVSLDRPNSLTVFLTHWFTVFGKIFIFIGDTPKIKASIITANSYTTHLYINCTDAVKPVQVAAVSTKQSKSVYSTSPVALTMAYCPVVCCSCLPFPS
jgi:hypothetical protein